MVSRRVILPIIKLIFILNCSISSSFAEETLKTALFVSNRAGDRFDEKIPVVEDFLSAKLAECGVSVISRNLLVGNLSQYDAQTASMLQNTDTLQAELNNATSAKRLAESLGADYILAASIVGFSERKKNISAYGASYTNYSYTLRMSYKLVDAEGAALLGDTVKAEQAEQNSIFRNEGVAYEVTSPLSADGTGSISSRNGGSNADEGLAAVVSKYETAVGLVVTTHNGEPDGMGTAWAIGPNEFATNAHITEPISEVLAHGGSAYIVLNKSPESRFRIREAVTHPQYMRAGKNFDGRVPAAPTYDVGILRVDGNTNVWFPLADRNELQNLDSGYRVAYLGFPMEGLQGDGVDPRNPVATMQSGIITSNTDWWQGMADYEERLLVQHNLGATGGSSGSPIFNRKGEVVALLNAGNIVMTVQVDANNNPYIARTPSAALINFGQRVDLLGELRGGGKRSGSAASAKSKPAPETATRVVFLDPDVSAFIDELIDEATSDIALSVDEKLLTRPLPAKPDSKALATIAINVETADLYIPDIRIGPENTVNIQDGELKVAPLEVTVEIDGVAVGSAPGEITVKPGFARLRLTRAGYEPWERMINAVDGQNLTVAMRMNEDGLKRWKALTAFTNELKNQAKLTDAQVKVLEGAAKMLEQSGFRVDTKEAPTVNYKSLF